MVLPVLPLRDVVYFPGSPNTLHVVRDQSVRALQRGLAADRRVLVLSQRDMAVDDPRAGDLYEIGTVCDVLQALPLPDTSMRVSLRGLHRAQAERIVGRAGVLFAHAHVVPDVVSMNAETEALMRECVALFATVVELGKGVAPEAAQAIAHIADPGLLTDSIAHHMVLRPPDKQALLEEADVNLRLAHLFRMLKREDEVIRLGVAIHRRVQDELGDSQREYYLREQLKAIQHELRTHEDRLNEADEYTQQIESAQMPAAVRERADAEVRRLDRTPSASPEAQTVRNYLDALVAVPWNVQSEDRLDVRAAAAILDNSHFGLEAVKERVLEHLAVRQLRQTVRGPVLCFVGPPGVGKTSIARVIAEAMGRKFARIALGGIVDEAELRGHRRTYIGSMPGRIVQSLIQCRVRNPLIVLDELDKLGVGGRGDPVSALLEILDPEQNSGFVDHYLDAPIDLSGVMFVATANSVYGLPPALRDRMEIVAFSGYTDREKAAIANSFLVPHAVDEHGLTQAHMRFSAEAIDLLIREYTRESGARELGRQVDAVCRKVARLIAAGEPAPSEIDDATVRNMLGAPPYSKDAVGPAEVGMAWGLVVGDAGGDVLPVEVALTPCVSNKPELTLTGNLGSVLRESAEAALTHIRGTMPLAAAGQDVHVHLPEGGVPKDGPSAGLTVAAALGSAFLARPLPAGWAMTGEISLLGRVLAVGGVREKLLAALRAGFTDVIVPTGNAPALDELPSEVRDGLRIHAVAHVTDAFKLLGLAAPAG
ncbi:MAG: endopeptidase La [Fimbriimonadaceae bacterium]